MRGVDLAVRAWDPELRHDYQVEPPHNLSSPPLSRAPFFYQFRGFVYKGTLTAISQFNQYCYFSTIADEAPRIGSLLQAFWLAEVRTPLGALASYVIDFLVYSDDSVKIINLHQFGKVTSSALFEWAEDADVLEVLKFWPFRCFFCITDTYLIYDRRQTLLLIFRDSQGRMPFEFRVRKEPMDGVQEFTEVLLSETRWA